MRSSPTQRRTHVNGVELAYFEWGEPGAAPTLLMAHATGLHARCWDQTVAALPQDTHVIAYDQRGHGRSEKLGPYSWDVFGQDLIDLVEQLDLEGIVGVGHSMGGCTILRAAHAQQDRFARLVLVDPVIIDIAVYEAWGETMGALRPEDHPTSKRKAHWRNWREMVERFEHRHPYSLWRSEVLEDYARYGVLEDPDGPGFVMACPPIVEASVYTAQGGRDVYPMIEAIRIPVVVMRGKEREGERDGMMDFSSSPTWPGLADAFTDGRDVYLPKLTHFIPMQEPELVAGYIAGDR